MKTKEVVCPKCKGERSKAVWGKNDTHLYNEMCEYCEGSGVWVVVKR